MNGAELFASYWWLMFPIFGMVMAFAGMSQTERRNKAMLDLIKSYIDQGKEPPADLVKLAAAGAKDDWSGGGGASESDTRGWSFVTFAAIAVGFGVAYYFTQGQDWSWVFLAVAAAMGVMAFGALVLLALRKKS